jgi:hypothetical protein
MTLGRYSTTEQMMPDSAEYVAVLRVDLEAVLAIAAQPSSEWDPESWCAFERLRDGLTEARQ